MFVGAGFFQKFHRQFRVGIGNAENTALIGILEVRVVGNNGFQHVADLFHVGGINRGQTAGIIDETHPGDVRQEFMQTRHRRAGQGFLFRRDFVLARSDVHGKIGSRRQGDQHDEKTYNGIFFHSCSPVL